MQTTIITSSHGDLTINSENGEILELNTDFGSYLNNISKFDILEFKNWFLNRYKIEHPLDELDILELGFWTKNGEFMAPPNWRYEIRKEMDKTYNL